MPFRPENVRLTLLLLSIVLLAMIGVFGAAAVAIWGSSESTPTIVYIGGVLLLALKLLLGMLLTELGQRKIIGTVGRVAEEAHETKDKVAELAEKADGGLKAAVKEVGEQVRAAERDQVLTDVVGHPGFKTLLAEVADEAVKRWCAQGPPKG